MGSGQHEILDQGELVNSRLSLPNRRNHITQKIRIAGQRTLYISVHNDTQPAEIFLRVKGPDCSSELIGLYDVIARLMSIALQYGAPLEKVDDLLPEGRCAPFSPDFRHGRPKSCTSHHDLAGRHLLVGTAYERCWRISAPQHDV